MKIVLQALLVGMSCGGLFTLLNLPLPAPPTTSGVAGIIGIFIGYLIVKKLKLLGVI